MTVTIWRHGIDPVQIQVEHMPNVGEVLEVEGEQWRVVEISDRVIVQPAEGIER